MSSSLAIHHLKRLFLNKNISNNVCFTNHAYSKLDKKPTLYALRDLTDMTNHVQKLSVKSLSMNEFWEACLTKSADVYETKSSFIPPWFGNINKYHSSCKRI